MAGQSGSQKRKRHYRLQVRLSKQERHQLDQLIENTGYSRAAFARNRMFGTPLPRAVPKPRIEHKLAARILGALGQAVTELRDLNYQLGKIGANLNQLTRYAHLERYQHHSIEAALADLSAMKAPVEKAAGMFYPIRTACLKVLGIHS